jgi:hypothetical protein
MNGMSHPRIQYPDLLGRSVPRGFLKRVTFNKWLPTPGKIFNEFSSVPDPEQDPDPYVFGPHGSRSVISLQGSGSRMSRSFHQQAKKNKKNQEKL